jgi:hypothetical protein
MTLAILLTLTLLLAAPCDDGLVTVDEIVQQVNAALVGCPEPAPICCPQAPLRCGTVLMLRTDNAPALTIAGCTNGFGPPELWIKPCGACP